MNPQLALVTGLVLPPLIIATLWFRRQSSKAYETARERIAAVNANLQEGLSGVRVSQAFVREETQRGGVRGGRRAATATPGSARSGSSRSTSRSSTSSPNSRPRVVLGVGQRARRERLADTSASSSRSCSTSTCSSRRSSSCRRCSTRTSRRGSSLVRIAELLDDADDGAAAGRTASCPSTLRGEVVLDDVRFRYATAVDEALRGVDLRIRPGETVALVGETGAGKSTVIKLVARFYDPTAARCCVDGVPVERLRPGRVPPAARRRAAGGVPVLGHDPRQHRLRPARTRPTPRSRPRPGPSARTTSSRRCPAATCSGSASAAVRCRRASASSSRSPARTSSTPRSCCSTRRRRTSTSRPRPRCSAAMGVAARGPHDDPDRPPPADRASRRPRSSSSTTAGSSRRARTTSCSPRAAATPQMWAAAEGEPAAAAS